MLSLHKKYSFPLRWVAGKKMITLEERMKKMFLRYIDSNYCSFRKYIVAYPPDKIKYDFLQFSWPMSDIFS